MRKRRRKRRHNQGLKDSIYQFYNYNECRIAEGFIFLIIRNNYRSFVHYEQMRDRQKQREREREREGERERERERQREREAKRENEEAK